MSADNGVFLRKEDDHFEVEPFYGDHVGEPEVFNTVEEALAYIETNCNDTEYGITLLGFNHDNQ